MNSTCVLAVWILSATIPLASVSAAQAGSAQPESTAKVKLEINGQMNLKQAIAGIMVPKLQAIPGVQVVDSDPQWTIRIETVVVPDEENKNVKGIGLSEVILEHRPYVKMLQVLGQAWRYLLSAGILRQDQPLDEGMRQMLKMIDSLPQTEDSTKLTAHRMGIFHVNNLQQACEALVTDFNVAVLHASQRANQANAAAGTDKPEVAAAPAADDPTK